MIGDLSRKGGKLTSPLTSRAGERVKGAQMPRHAAKIDANQPDLVKYLRAMGASFQHTHQIPGCLDGIVGYMSIDQRVEIKDPEQPPSKQKLTDKEQETFDAWRGRKPIVLKTEEGCANLLRKLFKERMCNRR